MLILLSIIIIAIWLFQLANQKNTNREEYFESQIIQTKRLRVANELPHYRGADYQRYLRSWTWKIISKHAMDEMKGKCEFCGDNADEVHHIYYPNNRKDLGLEDISSLCVACKKCHGILHGQSCDKGGLCALCNRAKANKTLRVKINKLGRNRQKVCNRCYAIASGFRDEAYKLSWQNYTSWIGEWQKRVLDDMVSQRGRRNKAGMQSYPTVIHDGLDFENAIPVSCVAEEYKWIITHFPGAKTLDQSLVDHEKGLMDVIEIEFQDGIKKKIHFDITKIFSK